MADITDPAAIVFSNERIRQAADLMAQGYFRAKAAIAAYDAKNLDAVFGANSGGDTLADGSDTDGRTPILGGEVQAMIQGLRDFVADMEANSNLKHNLVMKIAVHPTRGVS